MNYARLTPLSSKKAYFLIINDLIKDDLAVIRADVLRMAEAANGGFKAQTKIIEFNSRYLVLLIRLLNIYIDFSTKDIQTKELKFEIVQALAAARKISGIYCENLVGNREEDVGIEDILSEKFFEAYSQAISINPDSGDTQQTATNYSDKKSNNEGFKENFQSLDGSGREKIFVRQLEKAAELIFDEAIKRDLSDISQYAGDIFMFVDNNEANWPQIRKFANIYLPMTIKLCDQYIDLSVMAQQTQNVKELKEKIAKSIGNAKAAFEKLNGELLAQTSLDTESEITAFQNLLAIDGLLGKEEIKPPEDDT